MPKTLLAVRPVDLPPGHHIKAAVTGHAQIMAAIADHLNRAYARHEGLAVPPAGSDGQPLS